MPQTSFRPLPWLLATTSPTRVAEEMGRTRDTAGIAALRRLLDAGTVGKATFSSAVERVALIMTAKGGPVAGIRLPPRSHQRPPLLHRPPTAAPPQRGIPHPHRRRVGRVPRPLRAPPRRTRRLRTRLLNQLHPRALLHQVPSPENRPRTAAPPRRDPRQPPGPHHRSRARGLGRRSRGTQGQPLPANNKLAQADLTAARRAEAVHLGIPAYRDITAATLTAPGDPRER